MYSEKINFKFNLLKNVELFRKLLLSTLARRQEVNGFDMVYESITEMFFVH